MISLVLCPKPCGNSGTGIIGKLGASAGPADSSANDAMITAISLRAIILWLCMSGNELLTVLGLINSSLDDKEQQWQFRYLL